LKKTKARRFIVSGTRRAERMNLTPEQREAVLGWARRTPGVREVRLLIGCIGELGRSDGVDLALILGGIEVGDPLTLFLFEREKWEAALAEALELPVTVHWYDPKGAPKTYPGFQGRSHLLYPGQP
jgi:hypothetical protein